jgi:hypothetical protein
MAIAGPIGLSAKKVHTAKAIHSNPTISLSILTYISTPLTPCPTQYTIEEKDFKRGLKAGVVLNKHIHKVYNKVPIL